MKYSKLLVLPFLILLSVGSVALVFYSGSLLRFGVERFFQSRGVNVQVGAVSFLSLNQIALEYVRFSKTSNHHYRFELDLNQVCVTTNLFRLLTRGQIDRITFSEPRVYWGQLDSSLFNPLKGTCFNQTKCLQRFKGISFRDMVGTLSLKTLSKQKIQFDLFPKNYDSPFGVISGTFFEDKQTMRAQIDIQSANLSLDQGILKVNLAKNGVFTGLLALVWDPEYVSLNVAPYRLKREEMITLGSISFVDHMDSGQKDVLQSKGEIHLKDKHVSYELFHDEEQLKTVIKYHSGSDQPHELHLRLSKDSDKIRVVMNYQQDNMFLLDGYMDHETFYGELNWALKDGRKYGAPFVVIPRLDHFYMQLASIEFKEEVFPGMRMVFDVESNKFIVPEFLWGDHLVVGQGMMTFRPEISFKTEVNIEGLDTALLEPFVPLKLGEVFRGIISGNIAIQGDLLAPQYKIDLKMKDGYLKNLKYLSGEFHAEGQGKTMLVNESRFQRKKDTLFFDGEFAYKDGRIENKINYRTDGQAIELSGWILQKNQGQGKIMVEKKINDQLCFRLKNQSGYIGDERLGYSDTSVELEYNLAISDDMFFFAMQQDFEIMGVKRKYEF